MSTVNRQDSPPRSGAPHVSWMSVGEELRSRPGQWAHVASYRSAGTAASRASLVRRGQVRAMAHGLPRAVCRAVGGEYRLYARYMGGVR